jgi:hypothetical protein
MPSSPTSLATLRPDLATFIEFDLAMDRLGFIGHRLLPVLDVASQAGVFGKIPLEQLLQNRETTRHNGGGYSRGSWTFDDESYACKENGAEEPIDDREAKMYMNYFSAEQISAQRAFDAVLRNAEKRIAAMIFNASTWTGSSLFTSITNEWDDLTNATPITDVEAAVRKVWSGTGLWPNALIINRHVFRNLRNCTQVIDRITASGAGSPAKPSDVTAQMLAQVFDLEEIIVAGSAKNTATEGQTAVIDKIWSDEYAMVARICRSQDMKEPGLGRTFHWSEDGSQINGTVETYRDETIRGDVVRVRHDTHEKVLYVEAAHLMGNITT